MSIEESLSPREAFERLDPLLTTAGSEYQIEGDTLTYSKENPAAQDKLATFTSGTLSVANEGRQTRLNYDVGSTALLLCLLAPLLFLGFAQLAIIANTFHEPEAAEEAAEEEEEEPAELHWLDAMLGAPEPEQAGEEDEEEKDEEEAHSPTAAYVLAGIFAALFVVGRILEPWLLRRTLRKALAGTLELPTTQIKNDAEANASIAPHIGGTGER